MTAREVTTSRPRYQGTLSLSGMRAYHERLQGIREGIGERQSSMGENPRIRERLAEAPARAY